MKIAGIIAEFNPFHNGHKYLIDRIRNEINPDAVVVIMSGNFVQRGEPALQDKFERAELAVSNGADLVIELPTVYATASAGDFAYGAVKILKGLGCIDYLAFGCECDSPEKLISAGELCADEPESFKRSIKEFLDEGMSYASAYSKALIKENDAYSGLLDDNPNNILALEYIKQNITQEAGMIPYPVKRLGVKHDSEETSDGIASASMLRKYVLSDNDITKIIDFVPYNVAMSIAKGRFIDKDSYTVFYRLVLYKLLNMSEEEISAVRGVREGLENNIRKAILYSNDLDSLVNGIKSKRYTYTGISRILCSVLLDIDRVNYDNIKENGLVYAKVLAFNQTGQNVLKEVKEKGSLSVISNVNSFIGDNNHPDNINSLLIDIKSSDIYSIISGRGIYGGSDSVKIPRKMD